YSATGNTLSIASNRISYLFDLRGPSMSIDTACSSSLVALHQACNAIRAGEVETALAGGVNLLLHPFPFVS
ncbi:beta-ketoacyl synthase N-terminal-like domain-containing protein, partial [Klebsiella aerogenes]